MWNSRLKKICAGFYHASNFLSEGKEISCTKGTNWKFIFPWKVIKRHALQKVKALFRYRIWFLISEKSMKSCAFYSCGEHMHHGISSSLSPEPTFIWTGALSRYEYIYTYRMLDFKTFLKETYAIVLDSYYLFTNKISNGVCINCTFLKFAADLIITLQLKQMMNLAVSWFCN